MNKQPRMDANERELRDVDFGAGATAMNLPVPVFYSRPFAFIRG